GRDFFFSSRRRHTRFSRDWSSDVCSSDLPAHPATAASLHNLATLLDVREQYRTAEQLFARALAIRQEVYGEEHVDTASTLHNLRSEERRVGKDAGPPCLAWQPADSTKRPK